MARSRDSTIVPVEPAFAAERGRRRVAGSLLLLLGSLALVTGVAIYTLNHERPVSAALLFVIAVLINGSVGGLVQGLVTAIYVSLVYNLFVRFPVYRLGLDAVDDFFPIFALTLTAILSGAISGQLRDRRMAADRARWQLRRLFAYSNELQRAFSLEQIVRALTEAVPDGPTLATVLEMVRTEWTLPDLERWEEAVCHGLEGRDKTRRARADWPEQLTPADERAIANLTAMAIERCELLEEHSAAHAAIQSERLKTALLSSLSHDLRTPLAAIAATAGTLRSYGEVIEPGDRAEMLETILEQCRRLDAFTGKLLSLGQLEAGLPADRFETVDVEEVLGSNLAALRIAFPERRIIRRIGPDVMLTRASAVLLEQVLANVLENALRYSEQGTDVRVTLDSEGEMIAITVADQGCGIAPADLPHIFERFFRGRNIGGRSGHGLGLAITKTFLDLIGGQVFVTSPVREGRGTLVRILLPRLVADAAEEAHG